MTELESALLHIKTRADAWAVKEVEKALQEPTDTWSIKDVADTFKKHGLIREQEPCEDAISRHKAIVMITAYEGKSAQIEALEQLPSVQPSRKGHWIKESPFMLSECSECGNKAFGYHGFDETRTDFCPNCGAKMESEE